MGAAESQAEQWSELAEWIAALFGLWVLAFPFLLSGSSTSGTPYWSDNISGIVVAILAGYAAYGLRTR